MSPILVRPVREQFEHDRVIRLLQARWRRRFEVATNIGDDRAAPVKAGTALLHPDLVLTSTERGRRLHGVVEVETTESVNNLEALAEWAPFGKVRGAFYLYVPAGASEVARRLCTDNQVSVTEIWTYHAVGDQMRFTMVYRAPAQPGAPRARSRTPAVSRPKKSRRRLAKRASRPARRPARPARRTQKRR